MPFFYNENGKQNPNLATLLPRRLSRSVARNGFVDHCFIKKFNLFYNNSFFKKHLDTMANVMDCDYGKANFWK